MLQDKIHLEISDQYFLLVWLYQYKVYIKNSTSCGLRWKKLSIIVKKLSVTIDRHSSIINYELISVIFSKSFQNPYILPKFKHIFVCKNTNYHVGSRVFDSQISFLCLRTKINILDAETLNIQLIKRTFCAFQNFLQQLTMW